MKILFDHNVDRRFRTHLPLQDIQTTREMSWDQLGNGILLRAAADAGFEAFLSIDKKLEHEQNLKTLPLPVIVIDSFSNALPALIPYAASIQELLSKPLDKALYVVQADSILVLTAPRE